MNVFEWIDRELEPELCSSDRFIYDDMESQSGGILPIVHETFDAGKKSHWRDRGALFDYLSSTDGEGKALLDFGPGDGWPSLIVAPFATEVVGVDASQKRVAVCTENTTRLGISNARFVSAAPGAPLPFEAETFDGIMAASSVEQTPDPQAALRELFRVLRPGGRLRIHYEALGRYASGRQREVRLCQIDERRCMLIVYDRDLPRQRVRQYGLIYALSKQELVNSLSSDNRPVSFDTITISSLETVAPELIDARLCVTSHPSGETLASWLREIGFRRVSPTHSGSDFAGMLFDNIPEARRPTDLCGVDDLLRPAVEVATELAAPLSADPMITAAK